jgi:CO/xanthine dehydrogenase Mo-binding subunit
VNRIMTVAHSPSRRGFLKAGGALVVSFAIGRALEDALRAQGGPAPGGGVPAAAADLDSFLAIHADGTATIFTSHVDVGTGLSTVYRQMAAEELGMPVERFTVVEGDTSTTPNHGGTGGSSGVPRGGADIRRAAATARQAILGLAAARLNQPAPALTIANGEVAPIDGRGTRVSVASLIGGRRFEIKVDPNAPLREAASFTVLRKPVLRDDLPAKATGRHVYVQDHAVPGMLHARVIRPAAMGSLLQSMDESSISAIPGVRVVRIQNFLGVVAKDEWAAIRAARDLKVIWSDPADFGASQTLDAAMRAAAPLREQTTPPEAVVFSGDRLLTATYFWPFQSHASLGPSCAVADVTGTGATIWSSTQDAFGLRNQLARLAGLPVDKVRVVYMDGSGSYGSNGAYDAAADAVLLSRAVGAPVRVQWARQDELVWDPKGPAQLIDMRASQSGDGDLLGWQSTTTVPTGPQWSAALLGPVAAGLATLPPQGNGAPVTQNIDPPYTARVRVTARQIADTPIRQSNLRAPQKLGTVFAVESFTDELAASAQQDPVAYRRSKLSDSRALDVIDRASSMIGWQPRPSPNPRAAQGNRLVGRGFAYMRYKQAENYVAMAMEVAVNQATGKVTVGRVTCAHDCGLIMNPDGLRNQIEGCIVQALSRALHEEVTFANGRITSVDWASYPILRFPDAPAIDVATIDRPDQPAFGAGEAACAPVAAALANAIFDATGVRLRSVPFTSARVKAALERKG